MGDMIDGRFSEDTVEIILDAMVSDLETEWGEQLPPGQSSAVRELYRPIATRLAKAQDDIGLVLDATQIEFASGDALELLCALIGVTREPAATSDGQVTFSRDTNADTDYPIPEGTVVQTASNTPLRFVTTEQATLSSGTSSEQVQIEAEFGGAQHNVGADAITVMANAPTGVNAVTNTSATSGGKDPEEDDELRERAQEQLAEGARATGPALVSSVKAVKGVTSVTIIINDTPEQNGRGNGLPANSFELIVTNDGSQSTHEAVAQALMDTKAVGDYSVVGENGQPLDEGESYVVNGEITTDLPNGQTHPVGFSESVQVDIYVDAAYTYDPVDYPGDEAVEDAIVDYIGGYTNSGFEQDGDISTNDDVLYGEVEFAIRSVPGVYDISNLEIGESADPTGTANISIGTFEQAITDARDTSNLLTLTSSEQ